MGSTLQAWQKTAEKSAGFDWSRKSRLAAELVAEDDLTDAVIAERVGIGPRTLYRWKLEPVFVAEVEKRVEDFGRVVRSRGIARLERRIKALNDRWERMNRIIEERADDPAMANVPGGNTGLLVRRVKGVGQGDRFRIIESYEVDCRLLRALCDHERQAAQELGQWGEKPYLDRRTEAPLGKDLDLSVLTDEELCALERIMAKLVGEARSE